MLVNIHVFVYQLINQPNKVRKLEEEENGEDIGGGEVGGEKK